MIQIDWTLGVSALIFLITLVGLNRLLFEPLLKVLQERKASTTDVLEDAEGGQGLFDSKVEEYEGRLKEERQAGYQRAEEVRNETLKARQSRVGQARERAESLVAESRQKLEDELEKARTDLQQEAEQIALTISQKVLSR